MQPYTYGDPVTADELEALLTLFVPDAKKRVKLRRSPQKFLAATYNLMPNRMEHEVNRCRGVAFDAGEHGFSYSTMEGNQ